jgi:hypothetical protein
MTTESLSHKVSISETSFRQLTGLVNDLHMEIATEKMPFEAEVYDRLLFGTNGYLKSQTLAISWLKA